MNIRSILDAMGGFFQKKPADHGVVFTHDGNVVGGHLSMTWYKYDLSGKEDTLIPEHSLFGINCIFDGSDVGQASMIDGGDDFEKVMTIQLCNGYRATFHAVVHLELCKRDVGLTSYIIEIMGMVNIDYE